MFGILVRLVIASLLASLLGLQIAAADVSVPPKRISAELWKAYRSSAMFNVDGNQRNLRWTTSPGYFVKGSPNSSDVDTLNKVLATIGDSCDNIKPGKTSTEPAEGVILNFIKPSDFKTVIKSTPDDVTDSYLYWTYYVNRGITKTDVVISTDITDRNFRDYIIRLRVLQGFGFYKLIDDPSYNLFASSYRWETSGIPTKQDKELLGFYCSTYIKAWDTELQSQQLINGVETTLVNTPPSFDHRSKVTITNFGATVEIHPRGDLVLQNKVSQILLQVTDRSGSVVKNEEIDLSTDAYSIRLINLTGLEKKTSYTAVIYNRNSSGYGTPQRISFRTDEITSTGPVDPSTATDASLEALDAYNAALDAYNLVLQAKVDCLKAFQGSSLVNSRILNLVSGSQICNSQDSLLKAAYQRLLLLNPDKSSIKVSASTIDKINEITDQFNIFAEVMDEGIVFAEELRDSASDLRDVEALIEVLESYSSSVETVLERLPSKIRNSLYSKVEVAAFIDLYNQFLETSEEFKDALSQFSGLLDVDFEALEEFKSSVDLATRLLPSEESMDDAHTNALKVIPSFYCKKGKVLSLPSKGKCSSGSSKIKIDKTW